jgi:anti-sigma B factor antagonist
MTSSHDTPDTDHDEAPQLERSQVRDPDEVLGVRRETVGDVLVLHVTGEIDSDTAPVFREHLANARRETTAATPLIVDLSGVTYMASPGLSVLIEAHNEHQRLDTRVRVVAGSRATRVPIMTTGLHAQLDVVITMAQALPSTA